MSAGSAEALGGLDAIIVGHLAPNVAEELLIRTRIPGAKAREHAALILHVEAADFTVGHFALEEVSMDYHHAPSGIRLA